MGHAVTKRDQYALELVLAPQYIGISASGDVTTRNQQIAHLFVKNAGPDSLQQKVVSVRFVGDVAIVNGTYVMSWKGDKGPVLEKGIFSHVFEHVRETWLCLNSQRTVVAEENKGAVQEKPKAKHSDAELPLHVPLSIRAQTAPGPHHRQAATHPRSSPEYGTVSDRYDLFCGMSFCRRLRPHDSPEKTSDRWDRRRSQASFCRIHRRAGSVRTTPFRGWRPRPGRWIPPYLFPASSGPRRMVNGGQWGSRIVLNCVSCPGACFCPLVFPCAALCFLAERRDGPWLWIWAWFSSWPDGSGGLEPPLPGWKTRNRLCTASTLVKDHPNPIPME